MKSGLFTSPKLRIAMLIVLLGSTSAVIPPRATAQNLTLHQALEMAVGHSSALGMAVADQMHSLQNYREARDAFIPQVTVGSGLAYSYGFPLSLEGSAPTIFNLTSQSLLLNPAQRQFIKAARADWKAAGSQTGDQRSQVILDTVITYAELDKWEKKIVVLKNQQAASEQLEYAVTERTKEGIDSPVEQTKARLSTAQVRLRLAEAEGSSDVLRAHLAQLTGMPATSIATTSASIPELPRANMEEEDTEKRAVESSSAVKAADERARARELRALGEHKALYPAIDLAMQYGLISSSFTNFEQFFFPGSFRRNNATFGLVIRFPFLNSTQHAHASGADADALHARKEAQGVKDQVSLEALKLQRAVEQLAAAREVAQLQYELANGDLDTAKTRVQSGTATLRDLQNASLQANERSAQLLDAEFELKRAQFQLMRATGKLEQWALQAR
jgi:outer membrane protein